MHNFHMTSLSPHHIQQLMASGADAIVFYLMLSPAFSGVTLPDQGFRMPIDMDWLRYHLSCRHH